MVSKLTSRAGLPKKDPSFRKAQELEMPRFEKIKYKRWPIEVTKPVQVIQNKLPEAKAAEITINNNVVVEFRANDC